jgi:LacI family transcriptional regulator
VATLQDIADRCGVSRATVSRALSGRDGVSDSLRGVIEEAAGALDYHPNRLAQGLRTRRSNLIGLLLTNLVNASFHTIIDEVQRQLGARGYEMLMAISGGGLEDEERCLRMLLDRQVDGLILLGSDGLVPRPRTLAGSSVPVVDVIRRVEPQTDDPVLGDDRSGADQATTYLVSLGHRRIGLIVGRHDTQDDNERRAGYVAALRRAGIGFDPGLVREGPYAPQDGARMAGELLDRPDPPTALFIANHEAAFGALPVLAERRIEVPAALSVVVYEDAPWFSYWHPPLTVVDNQPADLAVRAVERLLAKLDGPSGSAGASGPDGGSRLIIRDSCGPPPT